MGVEFAFQCSVVLRTDLPTGSNTYGIVLCGRRGTTEWFMRAPRDAYPGAQTCMDSKVIRAGFGSGLIRPRTQTCCALKSSAPSGARQDNYADSVSACKLAGVQIIPLPTLANQILARTFFRSVANPFACPAVGKFSRASSTGGRLRLE